MIQKIRELDKIWRDQKKDMDSRQYARKELEDLIETNQTIQELIRKKVIVNRLGYFNPSFSANCCRFMTLREKGYNGMMGSTCTCIWQDRELELWQTYGNSFFQYATYTFFFDFCSMEIDSNPSERIPSWIHGALLSESKDLEQYLSQLCHRLKHLLFYRVLIETEWKNQRSCLLLEQHLPPVEKTLPGFLRTMVLKMKVDTKKKRRRFRFE